MIQPAVINNLPRLEEELVYELFTSGKLVQPSNSILYTLGLVGKDYSINITMEDNSLTFYLLESLTNILHEHVCTYAETIEIHNTVFSY